jgi:hypothetical protein
VEGVLVLTGLGQGPKGGFCEHSNKPLGSLKVGHFLTA